MCQPEKQRTFARFVLHARNSFPVAFVGTRSPLYRTGQVESETSSESVAGLTYTKATDKRVWISDRSIVIFDDFVLTRHVEQLLGQTTEKSVTPQVPFYLFPNGWFLYLHQQDRRRLASALARAGQPE